MLVHGLLVKKKMSARKGNFDVLRILHTLVIVFKQQRPVAAVDCRRSCLWLDELIISSHRNECHCSGAPSSYVLR